MAPSALQAQAQQRLSRRPGPGRRRWSSVMPAAAASLVAVPSACGQMALALWRARSGRAAAAQQVTHVDGPNRAGRRHLIGRPIVRSAPTRLCQRHESCRAGGRAAMLASESGRRAAGVDFSSRVESSQVEPTRLETVGARRRVTCDLLAGLATPFSSPKAAVAAARRLAWPSRFITLSLRSISRAKLTDQFGDHFGRPT